MKSKRTSRSGTAAARSRRPAAETPAARKRRARKIAPILFAAYPDARCMLDHRSPYELLVATILAAQCTDERVNMVTPGLFGRFPTPAAMASADPAEVEALVRSTGFFRSKARSVQGASAEIARRFGGRFPRTMEELVTLPGVGRKTANVVLGVCFDVPAIIVDTHVRRVASERLALADSDEPDEIERQLQPLLPPEDWTRFSHALTFHGRRCCHARKPDCPHCPVASLCPWPHKTVAGAST
jgi:endonuclease-3